MLPAVIIGKKRDGQSLSTEEIRFLMDGYARGEIPDYQISAWAMAVYLQGMDPRETADLTDSMIASGAVLSRVDSRPRVDKHSTGGLGDKVSLILAPLLACMDLHVPMISGRGLGITGGTLDKLESIPGFRANLCEAEIHDQLAKVGCVITGATSSLVPADRKLYALRDVTATVPSIPLITASIMSKKLAESLDSLVLDVKYGSGAFMQTLDQAYQLAASLQAVGDRMKLTTRVLLSNMNQPLGRMVGNACEVNESIDVLKGNCKDDVRELILELGAELMLGTGTAANHALAIESLARALDNGSAWERFLQMVHAQGGKLQGYLPLAESSVYCANHDGYLHAWDGQLLGQCVIQLGGGRTVAGQQIDPKVGLEMLVRLGERIERGQQLIRVFGSRTKSVEVIRLLQEATLTKPFPPDIEPLYLRFPPNQALPE